MEGKLSPAALRALRTDAKLSAHSPSGAFAVSDVPAPTIRADTPSPHAEPDPMPETKPGSGEGVCQRGCGLSLSGDAEHCCVDALRSVTDALEGRSASLERQVRMARLRWNRREQWLLARVTALQNEAQLAALQYQQRLHRYMVHIGSIAEQVNRYCQVRPRGVCFRPVLQLMTKLFKSPVYKRKCSTCRFLIGHLNTRLSSSALNHLKQTIK